MAAFLYSLRHVPDEEAEAIRALLNDNQIDFYETPAGSWGITAAAVWLRDADQLPQAKELLEGFHVAWGQSQQEQHRQLQREGKAVGFIDGLKQQPVRVIAYLALALAILYVSVKPFLGLIDH